MSVESLIFDALKDLVSDRVFPDTAPAKTARPYITYQQVGGAGVNFVDAAAPGLKNARFQINVWGDTRVQVAALAIEVEDTLRALAALQPTVEGAPIASYEADTNLRGSMQDFSFWFA